MVYSNIVSEPYYILLMVDWVVATCSIYAVNTRELKMLMQKGASYEDIKAELIQQLNMQEQVYIQYM